MGTATNQTLHYEAFGRRPVAQYESARGEVDQRGCRPQTFTIVALIGSRASEICKQFGTDNRSQRGRRFALNAATIWQSTNTRSRITYTDTQRTLSTTKKQEMVFRKMACEEAPWCPPTKICVYELLIPQIREAHPCTSKNYDVHQESIAHGMVLREIGFQKLRIGRGSVLTKFYIISC